MKTTAPYLRVIGFMILTFFLLEFTIDTGENWAIVKYPITWLVLGMVFLCAITLEMIAAALQHILFSNLSEEAKARYLTAEALQEQNRFGWFKRKYKELLGAQPIANEQAIILDHNYDGIHELDNKLPPWWTYLFYMTIVFALVYFTYYQVFDGPTQIDEYKADLAQAKLSIAEFKKNNKDLIDVNTVELLTESSDLAAGEAVFAANCVACHKAGGGGGIGPNLTDDYWILGGGIKNVFQVISEGGRAGKGMISWKTELTPNEMAQVASYVLSLHGTNPVDPKDPQGEIWVDENAPVENVNLK